MIEVEEVQQRLLLEGVLTTEMSKTVKDMLAKENGQTLAAKTLQQVCGKTIWSAGISDCVSFVPPFLVVSPIYQYATWEEPLENYYSANMRKCNSRCTNLISLLGQGVHSWYKYSVGHLVMQHQGQTSD